MRVPLGTFIRRRQPLRDTREARNHRQPRFAPGYTHAGRSGVYQIRAGDQGQGRLQTKGDQLQGLNAPRRRASKRGDVAVDGGTLLGMRVCGSESS